MYLQEMWDDDEWVPSSGAASSSDTGGLTQAVQSSEPMALVEPSIPEEMCEDPIDPSPSQSVEEYRCMVVRSTGPYNCDRAIHPRFPQQNGASADATTQVASSAPVLTIGVPVGNPLVGITSASNRQHLHEVRKVDEGTFTPNVEELLAGLSGPLDVIHNVSPAEVRKHIQK